MNNLLSNYGWGLPIQASTYAARIDQSLMILHVVMVAVFVLWGIYMAWCLVRYREGRNHKAEYTHHAGWKSYVPDVAMLVFEVWLVFAIGLPLWAHIREDLPKSDNATVVRVTAQQYSWLIHYPGPDNAFGKQEVSFVNMANPLGLDPADAAGKDDIVSVNALYAPLDKPILIELTAQDVIHSLFVPEFRMKQDAVPGMKIPVWVQATKAGQFEIGCAQLCGAGHYRMRGDVFIQTPEEYAAWVQAQLAAKGL